MTHNNNGHYAKKHPPDRKVKPNVEDALQRQVSDGKISCSAAHKISMDVNEAPSEVGFTMDVLEMRIVKCQMGLFGYKPKKKVVRPVESIPPTLEKAIMKHFEDGRLSCKAAWEIADKLHIKKMDVASACETLKIKISPCQLGAF